MHAAIIRQIHDLGYAVTVHKMQGGIHITGEPLPVSDEYTDLHAVKLANPDEQHIARVDKHGADALYRAAMELGRMVGMEARVVS